MLFANPPLLSFSSLFFHPFPLLFFFFSLLVLTLFSCPLPPTFASMGTVAASAPRIRQFLFIPFLPFLINYFSARGGKKVLGSYMIQLCRKYLTTDISLLHALSFFSFCYLFFCFLFLSFSLYFPFPLLYYFPVCNYLLITGRGKQSAYGEDEAVSTPVYFFNCTFSRAFSPSLLRAWSYRAVSAGPVSSLLHLPFYPNLFLFKSIFFSSPLFCSPFPFLPISLLIFFLSFIPFFSLFLFFLLYLLLSPFP